MPRTACTAEASAAAAVGANPHGLSVTHLGDEWQVQLHVRHGAAQAEQRRERRRGLAPSDACNPSLSAAATRNQGSWLVAGAGGQHHGSTRAERREERSTFVLLLKEPLQRLSRGWAVQSLVMVLQML
jgi:hypothetical protein